jgi:hypothetical protein
MKVIDKDKMKRNKTLLAALILLSLLALNTSIQAGAWTQRENGYFLRIYSTYLFATREFNHLGNELDLYQEHLGYENSYFRDISVIIYSEYGLTDWLTFIGELPFKSLTLKRSVAGFYARDELATTSGFADLTLATKLRIINDPVALSIQGGIMIPLGYEKQPQNNGPRLGSADVNFEGHILFGTSFYPIPMYFSGSVGYRYRTGDLNDEIIFTGEVGYTLGRFFLKTYVEVLRSVVTPPDVYGQRINSEDFLGGEVPDLIVGDHHLTKIIPSISYKLSHTLSIQAEIIETLSGVDTISGTTYSFGLVLTN